MCAYEIWATSEDEISVLFVNEFENEETWEGKLVLFEDGEHFTVEDVLNGTSQVLGKTNYGTIYLKEWIM